LRTSNVQQPYQTFEFLATSELFVTVISYSLVKDAPTDHVGDFQ